jgi:hypothetical protein
VRKFKEEKVMLLLIISVIFLLSLVGSYVLFHLLKSSASITNKNYSAGGAIAGFVILFGALFGAYNELDKHNDAALKAELKGVRDCLVVQQESLTESQIQGTIVPYDRYVKIVLGVTQTDPDNTSGVFRLSAKCIDPEKNDVKIYVISENGNYKSKAIYSKQDMKNLTIHLQ